MILITDEEFSIFQRLIDEQAGIHLLPAKKSLLEARLGKRIFELGLDSFSDYYRYLLDNRDDELTEMLDRVSTNETHFFREPRQFDFLSRLVVFDWTAQADAGLRPRHIRVWSAGCSTGEEPYSIAMVLWQHFPPTSGWEIEILATDLSNRALERARQAIWPVEKARNIPEPYLERFMLRGTGAQSGKMKAGAEIRSVIRFERLNLNDKVYPVTSLFDIVLCRNVLIYFDEARRARITDRLLEHLAPGGYFFIGHAERLAGLAHKVLSVFPTIYVRVGRGDTGLEDTAARREANGVQ